MNAFSVGKRRPRGPAAVPGRQATHAAAAKVREIPILELDEPLDWAEEAFFADEAIDALGPDVRYRMGRQRGAGAYDAGDEDDRCEPGEWLPAETNVTRARHGPWR
jgi:hypothetical protein